MTAKGRYLELAHKREPFLTRAYNASKLSIPSLLPDRGTTGELARGPHSGHKKLPTPYSSIAARGVNNLSSKMLLALFPPNQAFYRLLPDAGKIEQLDDPQIKAEVDKELATMEGSILEEFEESGMRVVAHEAIKHLLVAGNVLKYAPPKKRPRLYKLDSFVVDRDPNGDPVEIITLEYMSPRLLPPEMKAALTQHPDDKEDEPIPLFTWCLRNGNSWSVSQHLGAANITIGKPGKYSLEKFPYLPLRLTEVAEEPYGRGLIEEYEGSIRSAEGLQKAIVDGAAAAVRLLFLVNPDGLTREEDLSNVPNGGFARGRADDVTTLQAEKQADLAVAASVLQEIKDDLSAAFLLNSTVQRQAERVTAEEIRFVAQELEETLGGVYSILTAEWQLPTVNLLMARLRAAGRIKKTRKGVIRPSIVTGLSALGRGNDLSRIQLAVGTVNQLLGPQATAERIKPEGIGDIFVAAGVDPDRWVRSDEEVQQFQNATQLQSIVERLGPGVLDKIAPDAHAQ